MRRINLTDDLSTFGNYTTSDGGHFTTRCSRAILFSAVSKDPESADRAGNVCRCANDIAVSGLKKSDEIDLRLKHPVYTPYLL